MKLSEKLIKLRKEQGLSQEEFGEKIKVSRQAVSKWESEQSMPDVDKIKEIGKVFKVSFDYLLNDEIENIIEEKTLETNKKDNFKKHVILKIVIIIFAIYLIICLYKFIALYRFYKIADSFSEENYWIASIWENDIEKHNVLIEKVGDKRIETVSSISYDEKVEPYNISFLDIENKVCFDLSYNEETDTYLYEDYIQGAMVRGELDEVLTMPNDIKNTTLGLIPSNFKEFIIASINPLCRVSIKNKEIDINNFNRMKTRVKLTKDCLVESYSMQSEFDGNLKVSYSYDYVQDHFTEIENPLEKYEDKIEK